MTRFSRKNVVIAVFVVASALPAVAPPHEPAPRFTAKALDEEKFTNDTLKGKVVLLQFWTTCCPYCRRDQPAVDALLHQFADKGLVVLAVDVGESGRRVKQRSSERKLLA
jgi:thiol-disulfide isomerase/thioredoxin